VGCTAAPAVPPAQGLVGTMVLFFRKHFMVFLSSSCREAAENAIKKIEGKKQQEKSFFSSFCLAKSF
jgi:hypothetical protein